MEMYLGECGVYIIIMIGRWSCDAFLLYIRKQAKQFSHNVSSRMLHFQFHHHVLDKETRFLNMIKDNTISQTMLRQERILSAEWHSNPVCQQ